MRTSSSSLVCRQSAIKLKSYGTRVIENALVVDLVESVVWGSFAVRVMLFVLRLMLISLILPITFKQVGCKTIYSSLCTVQLHLSYLWKREFLRLVIQYQYTWLDMRWYR